MESQRKKTGRNTTAMQVESGGALVAVSPIDEELNAASPSAAPSNTDSVECRRSSRKKIPKFDVRDLLLKQHRKPHKIQIEMRIDSNAPSPSRATNTGNAAAIPSRNLDKCFIEKTSIIQRSPAIAQLPIPVTTEIFKPSQTSSLIVAQMESSTPSPRQQKGQQKSVKTPGLLAATTPAATALKAQASTDSDVSAPKRRGRPPKNRNLNLVGRFTTQHSTDEFDITVSERVEETSEKDDEINTIAENKMQTSSITNIEETKKAALLSASTLNKEEVTVDRSEMLDKELDIKTIEKFPPPQNNADESKIHYSMLQLKTKNISVDAKRTSETRTELKPPTEIGTSSIEEIMIADEYVLPHQYSCEKAVESSVIFESTTKSNTKKKIPLTEKSVELQSDHDLEPLLDYTISPSKSVQQFKSISSPPRKASTPTSRRIERRSGRRLDDSSSHKTLEETFADIAAKSSKAILEMATKDPNDDNVVNVEEQELPPAVLTPDVIESRKSPLSESQALESVTKTAADILDVAGPSVKKRGRKSKSKAMQSDGSLSEEISFEVIETLSAEKPIEEPDSKCEKIEKSADEAENKVNATTETTNIVPASESQNENFQLDLEKTAQEVVKSQDGQNFDCEVKVLQSSGVKSEETLERHKNKSPSNIIICEVECIDTKSQRTFENLDQQIVKSRESSSKHEKSKEKSDLPTRPVCKESLDQKSNDANVDKVGTTEIILKRPEEELSESSQKELLKELKKETSDAGDQTITENVKLNEDFSTIEKESELKMLAEDTILHVQECKLESSKSATIFTGATTTQKKSASEESKDHGKETVAAQIKETPEEHEHKSADKNSDFNQQSRLKEKSSDNVKETSDHLNKSNEHEMEASETSKKHNYSYDTAEKSLESFIEIKSKGTVAEKLDTSQIEDQRAEKNEKMDIDALKKRQPSTAKSPTTSTESTKKHSEINSAETNEKHKKLKDKTFEKDIANEFETPKKIKKKKSEKSSSESASISKESRKDKSAERSDSKNRKEKIKLEKSVEVKDQILKSQKQTKESDEMSAEKKKRKEEIKKHDHHGGSGTDSRQQIKSTVKPKKEKSSKDHNESSDARNLSKVDSKSQKKKHAFDSEASMKEKLKGERHKHKSKLKSIDAAGALAASSTPVTSKKHQQSPSPMEALKKVDASSSGQKKLKRHKESMVTPGSKKTDSGTGSQKSEKNSKSDSKEKVERSKEKEKEKQARKERQRKLEAALAAALAAKVDDLPKNSESLIDDTQQLDVQAKADESGEITDLQMPPTPGSEKCSHINSSMEASSKSGVEPDPFYDIAKFIEDGVNLLKRDYKLTENEEEIVEQCADDAKESTRNEIEALPTTRPNLDTKMIDLYETPADTPASTPAETSPSSSPIPTTDNTDNSLDTYYYSEGKRRSHRLKKITSAPKALVGRGLANLHYNLEDHLTDLAEVEAKNAQFLKDMEERLSNFQVIKESEYHCERLISREARKMICDCFLTVEEAERGELGCGEDCLNRLLMIECGVSCKVGDRCTNNRFQKILCAPCRVFRTEKKGFGIMADVEIHPNEFIMEYVGEVLDSDEFEKRRLAYSKDKNRHYYFMELRRDAIIDATTKGNISRFINHSCDPNAETQKWTVNGELRVGFFSRKTIMPGEEITFDYQYQRYGREAQRCYCESANCRGWIGEEPDSDEGEQVDDDDEEDEEEEEDEEDEEEEVSSLVEGLLAVEGADQIVNEKAIKNNAAKSADVELLKTPADSEATASDESKQKFMTLLGKITAKLDVNKQKNEEKKLRKKRKRKQVAEKRRPTAPGAARFLEDPDLEDEIDFLSRCGLKNQSDTLRFSRLVVRAKLVPTRLNLLAILRAGELPCRRLFLDYHGLHLLHGWMNEDGRTDMTMRLALVQTLECLPIANKTMLTESKVYQALRGWCSIEKQAATAESGSSSSPSDESSKESGEQKDQKDNEPATKSEEIEKSAAKLLSAWDKLPEIFRIPKRERIEQMKEHEREADRQYAATIEAHEPSHKNVSSTDRYQRDRFERRFGKQDGIRNVGVFGSGPSGSSSTGGHSNLYKKLSKHQSSEDTKNMSKEQRRELFAAKVAHEEAEKRLAERRREFETKCTYFGLDPRTTRPEDVPLCVSDSGQWFNERRQPITKPPSFAHVQTPVKPKSTNPADYYLPKAATNLPPEWSCAITDQGKIYYYHLKQRVPQWEPPTAEQISQTKWSDTESESDYDEDEVGAEEISEQRIKEIEAIQSQEELTSYLKKIAKELREERYKRLVEERPISPRREEDRIYNQIEMRKYKENKEKIKKRKEEIRRRRSEAAKSAVPYMCTLGSLLDAASKASTSADAAKAGEHPDLPEGALPIQDYLLSSDDDAGDDQDIDEMKAECNNSPLLEKIVQGDKIVDELDALTTKRQLKRALPPHRDLSFELNSSGASSSVNAAASSSESTSNSSIDKIEYKKRRQEKKEKSKRSRDSGDQKYRKLKEKFRCEIAGIIVQHLKPYRKESCTFGRIRSNEDFNHLARKLTHFVMVKELKYCEAVGQTLVVTDSVKNKSREFIKKYMAKYGDGYVRPVNDPEFKDIPFTL